MAFLLGGQLKALWLAEAKIAD